MSLHVFNNSQELIGVLSTDELFTLEQEVEINKTDTLYAEISTKRWNDFKEKPFYLAVKDAYEDFAYHLYKISSEELDGHTVVIQGVNVAFDELKAKGYIQDRRFNNGTPRVAFDAVVEGTDWVVTYIDNNLPRVNTNFYYTSRLEALGKLVNHLGVEVRFRVHVSGNKISSKRIEVYKRLSEFKGKRFTYGSNLLQIVKEEDSSALYTALVGRGKGEELEGENAYGRRITFKDVEWKKSSGHPVNKPLGQEFVEVPERTSLYGYPDGSPRVGIIEFTDTEDPAELLQQTYDNLLEVSRPKVQFKALVETAGDMALGETVAIIRPDIDLRYETRVFKIKRNLLNNNYSEVEFGDKLTQTMSERINNIQTTARQELDENINYVQIAANQKNRVFRGPDEPTKGMSPNDLWYKPVGDGETELYRWDGEMWMLEKVSAGLLGGTLDAESGDLDIVNLNANNITANRGNFINLALQDASSFTSIDSRGLRVSHPDGSYTQLTNQGLRRYTSTDARSYHYLLYATSFVYGSSSANSTRWMQLPDDFKGKPFEVYLAVADSMNVKSYHRAIQRIVVTQHPNYSIDYANAKVPIIAYKSETLSDGEVPEITDVQGVLLAIY